MSSYTAPPSLVYHPPCIVLIDPDSDTRRCGLPSGDHTILEFWPICDTCFEAVRI